ncbi:hypothetical protein D8Y22_03960 [Salinadaptatus halalkaliphilus]|uniref:Uncharacterized protein n=1 Tax=Salinadaptatus halalkaliphilus TaxID=2419781 RepID=A0A4S3TPE6_9EURY|nr:hypothetical protein [Salinadaptatus halalkaliphilus]THE66086.1 hypothetical protein D8Y22_03960 [Salinadaptatus halalkaliphilus]
MKRDHRSTRRRLLASAGTVTAVFVAGCGGPGEPEDDGETAGEEEPNGDGPDAEDGTGNGQDIEDEENGGADETGTDDEENAGDA